jgi:hypothetical protein
MSRILHIAVNNEPARLEFLKKRALNFLTEIQPGNITPNKEIILTQDDSFTILVNPTKAVTVNGSNVLVGLCYTKEKNEWLKPGGIPDGNYVIKRENHENVELLTDYVATKSLWYYYDDKHFFVSTSQRIIIHLLESFELNDQAVMWMLSSGTLGYQNSWDKRIKSIGSATILSLNKRSWTINYHKQPITFQANNLSNKSNLQQLDDKIDNVFSNLDFKDVTPVLALTGGYDSRTILLYLLKRIPISTSLTFGVRNSLNIKYSDLYVANMLAEKFNIKWLCFDSSYNIDNIDSFFEQFIKLGEGRIDVLERFSDGFNWLRDLYNQSFDVIINGMRGQGSARPFSTARLNLMGQKLSRLEDYSNIPPELKQFGKQELHTNLTKESSESWIQYLIKLGQEFFLPYADAALNEISNCYIDSINPLTSKSIVLNNRTVPDKQKEGKKLAIDLYNHINQSNAIEFPFANSVSVLQTKDIIRQENIASYINELLMEQNDIFPRQVVLDLIQNTKHDLTKEVIYTFHNAKNKPGIKRTLLKTSPALAHKLLELKKLNEKPLLDLHLLKYRMFLVVKMKNQLQKDAHPSHIKNYSDYN